MFSIVVMNTTAEALDAADPVRHLREEFLQTKDTYFLGNSLGLQPRGVAELVKVELDRWGELAVKGHFSGETAWLRLDQKLKPILSEIVGCSTHEVAAMNSLTVNLHLLLSRFYQPSAKRRFIITETKPFPSDWYALQSVIASRGLSADCLVELKPRDGESTLQTEDIISVISSLGEEVSLICMGAVNYYTGQLFEVEKITGAVHAVGGLAIWDCAHAVGAVKLDLHGWDVDAAVFCCYKYLNGGPGAVGGMFVHEKWTHASIPRGQLLGWFGHEEKTRFDMDNVFVQEPGIDSFRMSEIPALSAVCLLASLEIFKKTSIGALRQKSIAMTTFMLDLMASKECCSQINVITPRDPRHRGGHLSLMFPDDEACEAIYHKLTEAGFMVDYRKPRVIRVAPCPLYNKFSEIFNLINALEQILSL